MKENGFLESCVWPGCMWVTHAFVAVLLCMVLVFVVPQFVVALENFDAELPAATQMLIRLSSMLVHYWYLILFLLAVVDAAVLFGLSQVPRRLRWLRSLWFNATMLASILFLFFSIVALALPFAAVGGPRLDLAETRDTDALLVHVKGLADIRAGDQTDFEDNTLGLTNLRSLDLTDSEVTDAGLEHLKGVSGLSTLYLTGTQITDAGLQQLAELSSLEVLFLTDTPVTDAGLKHLEGLTNLRELLLSGTQVTDEGVQKLQSALPDCWISR